MIIGLIIYTIGLICLTIFLPETHGTEKFLFLLSNTLIVVCLTYIILNLPA